MSVEVQQGGPTALRGRVEIARAGVLSVARVAALVYAVVGLVPGVIFGVGLLLGMPAGGEFGSGGGPPRALLFGVGAIILSPLFYGILGFVFGTLAAAVYNFVAARIGGIVIETREL